MGSIDAIVLVVAVWLLWKLLGKMLARSPLDNIPGPPSSSFLQGNMREYMDRQGWDFQDQMAEKYGSVVKLHDILGGRALLIHDPRAMHSVLNRDQDSYEFAKWVLDWDRSVFGPGILSVAGENHRRQRKMLNPAFSTSHIREMTPVFYGVADRLGKAIEMHLNGARKEVDILNWMSRAALEIIGQAGLGYSFDPLTHEIKNDLADALKRLLPATFDLITFQLLSSYYMHIGSPGFRRWILDHIPNAKIQEFKNIVDTIDRQSREILRDKKAALEKGDEVLKQQVGKGKDILSILLRMNSSDNEPLEEEEILGQMSTFALAATDTTSNALSRTVQLLAEHQDVQEKLRAEVVEASDSDGRMAYEKLVDLPYLDAVCRETLRVYPPGIFALRDTLRDTVIPISDPITGVDGSRIDEIFVPKGTSIIINIRSSNRNKELWGDDAHEWKPERWLSPLPAAVAETRMPGVYSNLMSFSGGNRACIGFKFSQLEMKVILSTLLARFRFSPSDKDIVWNISGIVYPTVGKLSTKPSLPVMVEPIDAEAI
ncbi:hypothetical protein NM688_g7137 [Phlebia brevispora]|uniref:Uncharacterized protein n=1 Tax=Phlebia brevispora TaxID=194682 RepID=A0ACC1S8N0_9APHY|nr:hypothetical protein NM688_g7137 [Phlebia brevispora]